MNIFRKILKAVGLIIIFVVVAVALLLTYLSITEYKPADTEELKLSSGDTILKKGEELSVLSFNTGYAALGENQNFFMDGGEMVRPESKSDVQTNLDGIASIIKESACDIYFLQEVDLNSQRSYHIDETAFYEDALGLDGTFAYNFFCPFVPYPLPPIGHVESGLLTLSDYKIEEAERISLPVPFSWPLRIANLKRCMLVERIPIEGTDKSLVLINLHLEAYDDGAGKAAQTKMLAEFIEAEYALGNYVIAGGDFNQTFPGRDESLYPVLDESYWQPGVLEEDTLEDSWSFTYDQTSPTCRLLNENYSHDRSTTQLYVIDGFIVSPNVTVSSIKTLDYDFEFSDHNPVKLNFILK